MEIVRLQAIHTRGDLPNFPATFKLKQTHTRRLIFIRLKNSTGGLCVITGDLFDASIHKKEERIKGMASCREQGATTEVFFDVPFVLSIPRSDTVVIINFSIVEFTEQPVVNY